MWVGRGFRSLGIRRNGTPEDNPTDKKVHRLWKACGVPRAWTFDELELFLQQDGCFGGVDIQEKLPWHAAAAWTFFEEMNVSIDFRALTLEDTSEVVEFLRLGRSRRDLSNRALPLEWKQIFGGKTESQAQRKRHTKTSFPGALVAPILPSTGSADTSGDAKMNVAKPADDGEARLDDGKTAAKSDAGGPAKKPKAAIYGLAVGMPRAGLRVQLLKSASWQ